jgi:hypothetical protein
MIKRIILTLLQFIVFIALLAVGGNWDAINLALEIRAMQQHKAASVLIPSFKYPMGSHILIANGLIFATVLLLLILLFLLLRKKLHPWALLSLLAYVLAICLGFAMKLGLVPADNPAQARLSAPRLTLEDPAAFGASRLSEPHPIDHL